MNYKKELAFYARLCEQKDLVNCVEGNVSVLDRENRRLYITPTGTRKLDLKEEDVAVLDFDTEEQLEGKKASSEYRLHKAVYLARPDYNAVVHSHCTYLTAFALQGKSIKFDCVNAFALVKGEIKCLPYGKAGTTEIAKGIEEAIKDRPICLLGNHGVVCGATDLEHAEGFLEAAEKTVKTVVISKTFGEPIPIPDFEKGFPEKM